MDYFRLRLAQAGVLLIETNGSHRYPGDRSGRRGKQLAAATDGGPGTNFRLATPVKAGDVLIAIAGEGGRTGGYTLRVRLVVGLIWRTPRPARFRVGWASSRAGCVRPKASRLRSSKRTEPSWNWRRRMGRSGRTRRPCAGTADNGFGVLVNWNLLDDGDHAVRVLVDGVALGTRVVPGIGVVPAVVDGIEIGHAPVTVTTLGAEFVEGLARQPCLSQDFPRPGEQVQLVWQESQQNFVLAPAEVGATGSSRLRPAPVGSKASWRTRRPASFQSGIGVISGWVCEAGGSRH